jgi:hypothetical protein
MSVDPDYYIVLNKQQILGIANDMIAIGQNITIAGIEYKLMLVSEKYFKKVTEKIRISGSMHKTTDPGMVWLRFTQEDADRLRKMIK